MSNEYIPSPRTAMVTRLEREVAEEVWRRLSGNGSLKINIDTDVECYGDWEPFEIRKIDDYNNVRDAQSWVAYFVRSTINRLIDSGELKVSDE